MLSSSCDDQVSVYSRSLALIPSKDSNFNAKAALDAGKYVRYTAEQVQSLERLYNECPKPSSLRRQQLIRENPILQNIEPKQIKVWFQNRRCREKQRKESSRLQTVNSKLTAMNKLLMEENDRLQRQAAQLLYENGCLRQQLQHGGITTDTSCDSVVTSGLQHLPTPPQQSSQDATYSGILSLAEETLAEFLGKATGTAVDWVQIHGMKPGPDSTEVINISYGCAGIAARACGLVSMEAARIVEVLKDKASWHRSCRRMTTMLATSTGNGGCIEVLYTQTYAPTTLAPGRDFYTLRYSSPLDDGSFIVCERSMNALHVAPVAPQMQPFIRAEMHASGCLIKPCDSMGCIVILIDHMDLEPRTVPEVLRPLYESPAVLAHNVTIPALRQLRYLAQERMLEAPGGGQQPAAVRSLSYRLAKGFNDAINTLPDDGWTAITSDGVDDVTIVVKFSSAGRELGVRLQSTQKGVLCAKASMLLQNVPPCLLVRFLREHRSEWADITLEEAMRMGNPGLSGFHNGLSNSQVLSPHNIHAVEQDEFLELIKMEGYQDENSLSGTQEVFLLQLCSGLEEGAAGACAQMVFAPIDASISDDVELMPSGFRVLPLENGHVERSGTSSRTLDLASALEVGGATTLKGSKDMEDNSMSIMKMRRSVLSMAFQFNFEGGMENGVARMATHYVRNVVSTLHRLALALAPPSPPLPLPAVNPPSQQQLMLASSSPSVLPHEDFHLARWICRSYKMNVGMDLSHVETEKNQDLVYLKALWKLKDALLCCACKIAPVFTFANQAGLDMMEVPSVASLQEIPCTTTILEDESGKGMRSVVAQVMQQGYACLPAGIRVSSKGRAVSYERAVAWKVVMEVEEELIIHGVAFLFTNWSFLHNSTSGSTTNNMKLGEEDTHLLPAPLLIC
uniref:Class III homeodomain-leucine zipper protein n=1 Tax=Cyrtomium guizhouense TaxID=306076 RepID=A0A2S1CVL3_9MONI|nr:class III homeodomain-leucine zipper protein [Cyrtomium guizhouense]